jgi:predicted nucleotidyltransferase
MSNLLDLSGKINPVSLALYEALTDVAGAAGIKFFVVGATARDMIFGLGYQRPSRRATLDVDVGVHVATWERFENLKGSLLRSGHFTQTNEVQRLRYRSELLVDILPFGGIAGANSEIRWPPREDVTMSVVGFEDAYGAAQLVRVRPDPPLDILVASASILAILKIIAWADRPRGRDKDARDLAHILKEYLDAGNYERLLEDHMDLVEVEEFDYVLAGARLLGRDMAGIGKPETIERVREILARETADDSRFLLIQGMIADSVAADIETEGYFDKALAALRELKKGIEGR